MVYSRILGKMKKYLVRFTTKDGDYDKEWCTATCPEAAAEIIRRENWNVEKIDLVTEL